LSFGSSASRSESVRSENAVTSTAIEAPAATIAMALAVTAFSLFTDAVRDALDPRLQ
jgi:ABC-type dipeptide/oligopeptide/nickel transport system permease subunit